jgi:hypothetical protein
MIASPIMRVMLTNAVISAMSTDFSPWGVEPVPDRGVQYAAEPEAVGEGVAGERGQGDPTERKRLAQVAKRQHVVEHQQGIASPGQPKRSADPFPA